MIHHRQYGRRLVETAQVFMWVVNVHHMEHNVKEHCHVCRGKGFEEGGITCAIIM